MVAVLAAYKMFGARPPGGHKNIILVALAKSMGLTVDSIYKRLHNYANRDPKSPVKGLSGGGKLCKFWLDMAENMPEVYTRVLHEARKKYKLRGVI